MLAIVTFVLDDCGSVVPADVCILGIEHQCYLAPNAVQHSDLAQCTLTTAEPGITNDMCSASYNCDRQSFTHTSRLGSRTLRQAAKFAWSHGAFKDVLESAVAASC
jgi:hypothetical protein